MTLWHRIRAFFGAPQGGIVIHTHVMLDGREVATSVDRVFSARLRDVTWETRNSDSKPKVIEIIEKMH